MNVINKKNEDEYDRVINKWRSLSERQQFDALNRAGFCCTLLQVDWYIMKVALQALGMED